MDSDSKPKSIAPPLLPMFVPEDKAKDITDPKEKKLLSWLEDVTFMQRIELLFLIIAFIILAIHFTDDLIIHFVYGF